MPHNDSSNLQTFIDWLRTLLPYVSTLALSTFATIAQYAVKLRNGEKWKWRNLVLDWAICVFVALITHMLCEWQKIDGTLAAILIALSAHNGTRAMMQYEKFREQMFDRIFGTKSETEPK